MPDHLIFKHSPDTWQDLQDYVGQLFSEIGYHVEIEKTIELVRGKKEVDVYVKDTESAYQPTFLIECKHWKSAVPQEVVHSFQTVMEAFGANFGFIVAKSGFQEGAYVAAEKTNIRLVSLEDLEHEYYDKWQHGMIKRYLPLADQLFPYWDPSGGKMPADGQPISWDTSQLLYDAFRPIAQLGEWNLHGKLMVKYPMTLPVLSDQLQPIDEITLRNDRDFFDFIDANKEKATRQFKILYRE
jgi:Restriction endonuclease